MRLGARWRVGDPPHPSVPRELHEAIAAQEARHPTADAWTLTWLEGRPQCVLGDEVLISLDHAGALRVTSLGPQGGASPTSDEADDSDDWLGG